MDNSIRSRAQALLPELTAIRRDFHHYAEPGWLEMRTSSILARRLTELGYEVLTGADVCKGDARMGLPPEETLSAHYEWAKQNGADAEFLHRMAGGFTGAYIGLYATSNHQPTENYADFDWFEYQPLMP